ncbi:MAG: SDR family NAD(P)-dependent oxidoreductase [Patescibacteria group bacterium]|nr:SDR family NAD(P)-dependent oxidoreductase [Patescibacteria group bacterium]MDD4304539.1 SDR family NAD(P)-dependent oxidoreductase [Patescibacteria group bacterium]MDD4695647.1 SDR family NAD(P)-dependent oxidoreductase [Patescibacteria group bacterium]
MFKNKLVLITGGSSGIGKATAIMFAKNSANIIITYKKNKKGADETINEIKNLGKTAFAVKVDLTNEKQIKKFINIVIKKFGKIDILVNNAGIYLNGDEWNKSSNIWLRSIEQNLISTMNISKHVIEIFLKQKNGVMINISSRLGLYGAHDAISYSVAKAGIINITQSYAKLLFPFGRVNSVCPWVVNSGYWLNASKKEIKDMLKIMPKHKLIEPEKIAKKIVFLASDKANNITGQNFIIK